MNLIKHKPSAGSRLSGIERYNRRWGLLLISPWLIGVIIFKLGPILASLVLSLTDFMLLDPGQTQFIGLQNYIKIFQDSDFWFVLFQTIFLAVLIIPVQTCSSILLATVLSHRRLKMKNTIRSLFYLPSIIPSTAALLVTDGFINPTSGWLNRLILGPFGLAGLNTLYTKNSEIIVFALTSMWAIGPGFLIIMAALQKIPGEIHEAARLDGANPLVHYLAITLPLVSPAIFFFLVINLTAWRIIFT
jgi:multiple sugar transport system permease protein